MGTPRPNIERVIDLMLNDPDLAYSVKDLSEKLGLTDKQIYRVVQHLKGKRWIKSVKADESRHLNGMRVVYYTLTDDVHASVTSR